jgi:EamA domain-containing membrane protein RarD
MSNNNIIKGVFLVALGATSYGMLATFVKLAYQENFTTAEVTSSQFIYGIIGILIIKFIPKNKKQKHRCKSNSKKHF